MKSTNANKFSFLTIFIIVIVAVLLLLSLLWLVKHKKTSSTSEMFTSQCQSLLSTSSSQNTWTLVTDTTIYNDLVSQRVESSNIQDLSQGLLQNPCFTAVNFYYSGVTTGSALSIRGITSAELNASSSGDYYGTASNVADHVYLYPSCVSASAIPGPQPYFVAKNTDKSNAVSIGNTSMQLYDDYLCTLPFAIQTILQTVIPDTDSIWSTPSSNLQIQAWGPVIIGLGESVNRRFPSLLSSGPPAQFSINALVDNKVLVLEASSSTTPSFPLFVYNTHTGFAYTLNISFVGGFVIPAPVYKNSGDSFSANMCLRATSSVSSVNINGQQISGTPILVVGPEIPTVTEQDLLPSVSVSSFSPEAENPTPTNPQLPDAAYAGTPDTDSESTSPPRLLRPVDGPPEDATQDDILDYCLVNLPRIFDWRVVGGGRIETIPRNQGDTQSGTFYAIASFLGDSFSLTHGVMPTYPSAFGYLSAMYDQNFSIRNFSFPLQSADRLNPYYTRRELVWPSVMMMDAYDGRSPGFLGQEHGDYAEQGVGGNEDDFAITFQTLQGIICPVLHYAVPMGNAYTAQQIDTIIATTKRVLMVSGPFLATMLLGNDFLEYWGRLGAMRSATLRDNSVWTPFNGGAADEGRMQTVTVVGFGEVTGPLGAPIPYWIVRIPWGDNGNHGFFNVEMATTRTQGFACPELPWSYVEGNYGVERGVDILGPVYLRLTAMDPVLIQNSINNGALVRAPPREFEYADSLQPFVPACGLRGGCNTVGGEDCFPLLAPRTGRQNPPNDPHAWIINNSMDAVNRFINFPMEFYLRSTQGISDVIAFVRRNPVSGDLIGQNGIEITHSDFSVIPVSTLFRYDMVTGMYFAIIAGLLRNVILTIAPLCTNRRK